MKYYALILIAVISILVAGCGQPALPSTIIPCQSNNDCPTFMPFCASGLCLNQSNRKEQEVEKGNVEKADTEKTAPEENVNETSEKILTELTPEDGGIEVNLDEKLEEMPEKESVKEISPEDGGAENTPEEHVIESVQEPRPENQPESQPEEQIQDGGAENVPEMPADAQNCTSHAQCGATEMCYNSKCIPAQCGVPGITCNGNTATKGLACMNRLCVKCTKNDDCYKVQFPNTQPTLIPGMKCDLTPNSPTNGQCKSECSTNTECETKSNNSTSIVTKLKRKCGDAQDYSQSCKTTGIGCTCVYETCTIGPNPQCAQGAACLSTSSSSPYFGKNICTYCVADNDCKDAQYKTCIANQCKQP